MTRTPAPPEGFAEFVATRSHVLLRAAWLLTGDAGRAEDLLQTALARSWQHWDRIAVGGSPEAYVRRVLYTTYSSWWQRRWRGELPSATPPDRLAAVGRKVRRRRRLTGMLAAVAVAAVLIGGAAAFATARPGPSVPAGPDTAVPGRPGAGDCPAAPPARFGGGNGDLPSSAAGDLARAGAVRAVFCRYIEVPELHVRRPGPPRRLVLTRDVGGLVTALNTLPTSDIDPCFTVGLGGGHLTLEYGDGSRATGTRGTAPARSPTGAPPVTRPRR
ncbi:sigma factor [Dactylosporangium sp. NPDC050588]|uniref:sigma factor n=1 Tax=Dactylosporangium sp. NPDC050588 TaxID=3157211 RepID=UPI0033CA1F97